MKNKILLMLMLMLMSVITGCSDSVSNTIYYEGLELEDVATVNQCITLDSILSGYEPKVLEDIKIAVNSKNIEFPAYVNKYIADSIITSDCNITLVDGGSALVPLNVGDVEESYAYVSNYGNGDCSLVQCIIDNVDLLLGDDTKFSINDNTFGKNTTVIDVLNVLGSPRSHYEWDDVTGMLYTYGGVSIELYFDMENDTLYNICISAMDSEGNSSIIGNI